MNRWIMVPVAVVSLASGAPLALAEAGDVPPEVRPERLMGLTPEEEAQLLQDAERIVLLAEVVVEAEADRILAPSPKAEFLVREALKAGTDLGPAVLTVDLTKAPVGVWPRVGERKILCLAAAGAGGYELAAYHASILPSTDTALRKVSAYLGIEPPAPVGPEEAVAVAVEGAPPPAAAYRQFVRDADTVLVGALSNIERTDEGTEGVFRPDEEQGALLGYDGFRVPVIVRFAAGEEKAEVAAGRYVVFLREDRTGEAVGPGFDAIGALAVTDAQAEAKLKREIGSVLEAELGPERGRLTTIQATLAEWQQAWNARDLDRCIKCYAGENPSRKLYEAGDEARKGLAEQVRKFASTVAVSLQRVKTVEAPEGVRAEANVLIELTVFGTQDRRRTNMTFAREGGEWLILDEGL